MKARPRATVVTAGFIIAGTMTALPATAGSGQRAGTDREPVLLDTGDGTDDTAHPGRLPGTG